jgi:hypothetical protein
MKYEQRIIKVAAESLPGGVVIFAKSSDEIIQFRIEEHGTGRVISKRFLYYSPAEIDALTDAQLRSILRAACQSQPETLIQEPIKREPPKCPRCGLDGLTIARRQGFERIMIALTGTRKYRCPHCDGSFRAPDHRRV